MERGLYIAAAGMLAEQARQDQISTDLANAGTAGYKQDRVAQTDFADVLLQNSSSGQDVGRLGTGPVISKQVTDFSQGAISTTSAPLDAAIQGTGFFAVQAANGVRYTRDGTFQSNGKGQLTDQFGNLVLSRTGKPITLQADGTVKAADIGVYALKNPKKAGDGQFTGTPTGQDKGIVQTGALEASGVDSGRVMVDMMASLRAYEANQKTINTIDQTLQAAAQQVANLPG